MTEPICDVSGRLVVGDEHGDMGVAEVLYLVWTGDFTLPGPPSPSLSLSTRLLFVEIDGFDRGGGCVGALVGVGGGE